MATLDLRKKLIAKINVTNNDLLLEEAFRLLSVNISGETVYELNDLQQSAVAEARVQFNNGKYLSDKEVNKEIDKWLEE